MKTILTSGTEIVDGQTSRRTDGRKERRTDGPGSNSPRARATRWRRDKKQLV